jgi:GntR family transcriptional regulator, vanillate catabolism transcriptional regulator
MLFALDFHVKCDIVRLPYIYAIIAQREKQMTSVIEITVLAGRIHAALSREFLETLEIEAAMQGVAARLAAEDGVREDQLCPIRACLAAIDQLLGHSMSVSVFEAFVQLNVRFHELVLRLCPLAALAGHPKRDLVTPFRLPDMLPVVRANLGLFRRILVLEQEQHRSIVEAIERGHGARAEDLLRDHSRLAERQLARDRALPSDTVVDGDPNVGRQA